MTENHVITPLTAWVNGRLGRPFSWGEADCMTFAADWVLFVTGRDPMAELRGAYDTRGGCVRETGFFADPVGVSRDCAERVAGLRPVNDLRRGDVALACRRDDPRAPFGAIWSGRSWWAQGPKGVTTLRPALVETQVFWGTGYAE